MIITTRLSHDEDDTQNKRAYQKARWDEWQQVQWTERSLFGAVLVAWRQHKASGWASTKDVLSSWVTRQQIADKLEFERLIPYYVKLLNHLSGGKSGYERGNLFWIIKAKRTRWRQTYEGRQRPAGYEWVYFPKEEVAEAIIAMDPDTPQRRVARLDRTVPYVMQPEPTLIERMARKLRGD